MPKNGLISVYRFVFIWAVVMLHFGNHGKMKQVVGFSFPCGYSAVEFFFILAGFLLAVKMNKSIPNTGEYFVSRIWRIYPVYFVSFCLTLFGRYYLSDFHTSKLPDAIYIILDALMLGGLNHTINLATWFITALILAQIIVVFMRNKIANFYIISLFIVIFIYANIMWKYGHLDELVSKGWYFDGFGFSAGLYRGIAGVLLGCVVFKIYDTIRVIKFNPYFIFIAEIILFVIAIIFMMGNRRNPNDFLAPILFSGLILCAFLPQPKFIRFLDNKFVNFFGALSLSIYLSHIIVLDIVTRVLRNPPICVKFYTTMVAVLIVSIIVHFIAEKLAKFANKKLENLVQKS